MLCLLMPGRVHAFGEPLATLAPAHLEWFEMGRDAFTEVYTAAGGLGPIFNSDSCASCHAFPAPGGGSAVTVIRFGRMTASGFDPLINQGGPLLQARAIDPACVETIPAAANVVAERMTTPLYGAGLVEAILDDDLLRRADPDDQNGDGISGRANLIKYPGRARVGRFGWKAQEATLLSFSADALVAEMGLTNVLEPNELAPNGDTALSATCKAIEAHPDPDDPPAPDGFTDLVNVTNFTRLLAPPPQPRPRGRGWLAFRRLGCERCHVSRMRTGPHTIPALAYQTIYPYSDYLLHDMGSLGDGIVQVNAGPTEMRTAPLWGIHTRTRYLHDGRAATLFDAIVAHDGEAAAIRDRFLTSSPRRQQDIITFVAGR